MSKMNYQKFAGMLTVSFVIMYAVMYLNVADTDHIYLSATRLYMTLLMVAPMALVMLLFMPAMYPDKKANAGIMIASVAVFVLAFVMLRKQVFISDIQYMKAMIPHHSSAIMTSQNANIQDPEVKKLSEDIIKAQEKEIAEMKAMIKRLEEQ